MRTIGLSLAFLLCLAPAAAPAAYAADSAAPAVEITAEPSHHLALENGNRCHPFRPAHSCDGVERVV
jgi:hypothetical protein